MQATAFELEYAVVGEPEKKRPVIVVAAGSSSRMAGVDKQLLPIGGIPVLVRTLLCFERAACISRIILVTREAIVPEVQTLAERYHIEKLTDITLGGADRHASVMAGLSRLTPEENQVLIHDGARPFVTETVIAKAAEALDEADASLPAVPIHDTVKQAGEDGLVQKTLDRRFLFAAQTPQGVRIDRYRKALESAADPSAFTDDASVMESAGYTVRITPGSFRNIKITTREDIVLAEAILKGE